MTDTQRPDIEAILERHGKATAGEWHLDSRDYHKSIIVASDDPSGSDTIIYGELVSEMDGDTYENGSTEDKVFMAAAHQDVPALVAYALSLEQDAIRYRALVKYGPPGVHSFVTGIHPSERSSSRVSKELFDSCVDELIAENGANRAP